MSQKKKPGLYYFGEFLNALRKEGAEIKYRGKTYSSKNRKLTIKSLAQEICNLSEYKISHVLRKGEHARENTRKGRTSPNQRDVINQLDFYFVNDKPTEQPTRNRLDTTKYGSQDLFKEIEVFREKNNSSVRRSQFYANGNLLITDIYPDLPKKIIESVINTIRENNIEDIYKLFYLSESQLGPFKNLTDRLYSGNYLDEGKSNSVSIEIEKKYSPENLEKFINEYESKFSELLKANRAYALALIYPQCKLERSAYLRNKTFKGSNDNFKDIFSDLSIWFDQYRYRRFGLMSTKLSKVNVNEWPNWTVEHIILAHLEYIYLRDEVENIVLSELNNNVHFALHTSSHGATIDMQNDFVDLQTLADTLVDYRFPGGIGSNVNIKGGNILNGNYFKNPSQLVARNQQDKFNCLYVISEALNQYLSTTICNQLGFYEAIKREMVEKIQAEFCESITLVN